MKHTLTLIAALLLAPVLAFADEKPSLLPPKHIGPLLPEHAATNRVFTGIPSLAVAPKGRLWSTWYAGATGAEDLNNYVVLATSGDGGATWAEVLTIDPDGSGHVRSFDPELWVSSDGRLFVFWAQMETFSTDFPRLDYAGKGRHDTELGVWCIETSEPDAAQPKWSTPRRIADGVMMCKPLTLTTGEWVLPISTWRWHDNSAQMIVSTDEGKTWALRGACNVPVADRIFDEHMFIERKDGSLWLLVRTKYGIGESVSTDRGKTWPELKPSAIVHPTSRFFIRRLASGNLLLVKHGPLDTRTSRSHLTAFISTDDGHTWGGGLLLDDRLGVSYPDGQQTPDGLIHIIYDYNRSIHWNILMATFREEDAIAGKAVSADVRLRQVVRKYSVDQKTVQPAAKSVNANTTAADLSSVADGKTDATALLQQIIDSGTGDIALPKGSYLLTKTLTVDLDKTGFTSINGHGVARLIMSAAGPAIHFIGTHEGTAAPESVKANVFDRQRTPMVDALEIIGTHEEADGIEATGTVQLIISRSTVRDCRHGVHLTVRNRNVIITDCHIYKNRGIGVFYDNVNLHQSNIIGSHISYCRGGGVVNHGGNVRNLQIGTCDIESNMAADSPPTANVWLDSTGGSIGEVTITGCTLQHSSKAPGCANIRIEGAGDDSSLARRTSGKFTREGNVTITANVFSDIQCNVHIKDSRGVTVTGNTFWEGFQQDLLVESSSHIVVSNNNFDRNPRYLVNGFNAAENNGIIFKSCSDCIIQGNVISGVMRHRAAMDISDGSRLNIAQNSVLDSDGIGILLENVKQSLLTGCIIRDDREEAVRSKEPSLKIVGGSDNLIGPNLLGNGKVMSKE